MECGAEVVWAGVVAAPEMQKAPWGGSSPEWE